MLTRNMTANSKMQMVLSRILSNSQQPPVTSARQPSMKNKVHTRPVIALLLH